MPDATLPHDELTLLGVHPDSRAARDGLLLHHPAGPALALPVDVPEMTTPTVRLCAAPALLTEDVWPSVAEQLRTRLGERRVVARTAPDLPRAAVSEALTRVVVFVQRQPDPDADAPDTGLVVRPMDAAATEEVDFVLDLLADALASGMAYTGPRDRHREQWRARLRLGDADSPTRPLIAWLDGRMVGHITSTVERDPFTDEPHVLIHDTYTVEEAANRGVARTLTAALERDVATDQQLPIRGSVVVAPGTTSGGERVLSHLVAAGWTRTHAWWAG